MTSKNVQKEKHTHTEKSVTKNTVKFTHKKVKVDTLGFPKKSYPNITDNISPVQSKRHKKIFELNKTKFFY